MTQSTPLSQELAALHDAYVAAVNQAIGADNLVLADELALDFDRDSRDLLAQRAAA